MLMTTEQSRKYRPGQFHQNVIGVRRVLSRVFFVPGMIRGLLLLLLLSLTVPVREPRGGAVRSPDD